MSETSPPSAERVYLFGPFRLLPAKQLLIEGDTPVRIGGRAFDVLTALVEQAGSVVPKNELMTRAWPRTVVEESNLKVTVAALRRVLGEERPGHRYLANVPGRGYRFVAPVQCADVSKAPERVHRPQWHNLPHASTRMVGRVDVVTSLAQALPERRLVSVVGPGGIGKTTVALGVARTFVERGEHDVGFVNLASLPDARFVPMTVAKALGVTIHSENAAPALALALRDRRLLIVLDSCEHVLETTAALVDEILAAAPDVLVLTTTREPLRAQGETIHRLAPLNAPPSIEGLTASEAQTFAAVELFVERASASREGFTLTDADAPVIADICRKLEGIALAIELTATRVDTFTLRELSSLLENRFRLLNMDRRTAVTRHRSLAAALDWSHELLTESERAVLRRLSVFSGAFTLASALAVADDRSDGVAALEDLVAKSLVSADVSGAVVRYRLLDTTRAYAAQKLDECGERIGSRRRHAEHYLALLTRAEEESTHLQSAEWLADHGRNIDDVRSALSWAHSAEGDAELAVALTIAAIPLWTQLSLLDECRVNAELALARDLPEHSLPPSDRMKLLAALGVALLYTRGPQPVTETLWKEALSLAERVNDVRYQLRMLWALPVYLVYFGDYRAALGYLRRLRIVARKHGDSADRANTERLIATTFHYFGGQRSARQRLDRVLQTYGTRAQQAHISRFQFDQRATARGTLATILWLQGHPTQAAQMAREAVADASAADHPISLCNALGLSAFPIALYVGDLPAAERYLKRLLDHLSRNSLAVWRSLGDCLEGMPMIERGELAGVDQMQDSLERLVAAGFRLRQSYFLGALARGQARAGRLTDALTTIESALGWCERTGERWFLPEVLRLKGDFLRAKGSSTTPHEAEQCYRQAIDWSQRQGALAWELRATTSLTELCADLNRPTDAIEALVAIRAKFTEGFETVDLQRASFLISRLQDYGATSSEHS